MTQASFENFRAKNKSLRLKALYEMNSRRKNHNIQSKFLYTGKPTS